MRGENEGNVEFAVERKQVEAKRVFHGENGRRTLGSIRQHGSAERRGKGSGEKRAEWRTLECECRDRGTERRSLLWGGEKCRQKCLRLLDNTV